MEDIDKAALIALNKIFGFNPKIAHILLDRSHKARDIFYTESKYYKTIGLEEKYIKQLSENSLDNAYKELEYLNDRGEDFISLLSPYYPKPLKECPDAPIGLYSSSQDIDNIFNPSTTYIAIVGSRDSSNYGRSVCFNLIKAIADSHPNTCIISGLALGIDSIAHRSALENNLSTLAVMATGLNLIYPSEHQLLAKEIKERKNSALITDYPLDTQARPINFVRRNRIIAGLCSICIVIESKIKGGSLITARLANSYNRNIYALPARITDHKSAGCNKLIKENLAIPLNSIEEFIEEQNWFMPNKSKEDICQNIYKQYSNKLLDKDLSLLIQIFNLIQSEQEINMNDICKILNYEYPIVSTLCNLLESDDYISIDLMQNCYIDKKFN